MKPTAAAQLPIPPQGEPTLAYLLADEDITNYRDSCEHCLPIYEDRDLFVATPYRVDVVNRQGLVAFYEHACGARWWTSWGFFYGPK